MAFNGQGQGHGQGYGGGGAGHQLQDLPPGSSVSLPLCTITLVNAILT